MRAFTSLVVLWSHYGMVKVSFPLDDDDDDDIAVFKMVVVGGGATGRKGLIGLPENRVAQC